MSGNFEKLTITGNELFLFPLISFIEKKIKDKLRNVDANINRCPVSLSILIQIFFNLLEAYSFHHALLKFFSL